MKPQDLRCHYCRHFDDFEGIVEHSIQVYANEEIKMRRVFVWPKWRNKIPSTNVLNCGLIPNTLTDLSNVTIDNNNWTVKVNVYENSKKRLRHNEQSSKRIRIDNADLESSEDIDPFARQYEELCKIHPDVAKILHSHNQLDILLEFFMIIVNETFNVENICYHLINFLSSGNTHAMRYQANVKHCWRLGYKMFGGRFLRFMGWFKNTCQIADGSTSHADLCQILICGYSHTLAERVCAVETTFIDLTRSKRPHVLK